MVTQSQIDCYVMGALAFKNDLDEEQLTGMAMLHFDIFYDETNKMVKKALKNIYQSPSNKTIKEVL